ncbi:hypothetical protein CDD80_3761 [Ophiocordyceps camponoti-rufipedis]|uniref:Uncharacterized protein n=1 Tax=Ophiocordyceps camponoti-rufipedis TaxID=2004952 RepID=A0A2C5YXM6_9HYPO|nr:hypothetical protein CDD80_3761 [Ophiocordyceps camponoti-rufipedis]
MDNIVNELRLASEDNERRITSLEAENENLRGTLSAMIKDIENLKARQAVWVHLDGDAGAGEAGDGLVG